MEPEYAEANNVASAPVSSQNKPLTRAPNAELQLQLISDIGPELVQRWAESRMMLRGGIKVIPALYRALLSAVLRAASMEEADDFLAAHRAIIHAHVDTPGAVLGFSSQTSSFTRTSVWHDIFHSASRDNDLLPSGPALSFYNSAGAGSGDSEEYASATVDQRVDFCESDESLPAVRQYALSLVLNVFAAAVRDGKAGPLIADCLVRFNANTFLMPFIDRLPSKADCLDQRIACGLHDFFDAYYHTLSTSERTDLHNRLVRTVMSVARDRPQNVFRFLQDLPDVHLRFKISRVCLLQRFGIADDVRKQLSPRRIYKKYLSVSVKSERPNAALPGLLAILLSAWCLVTEYPDSGSMESAHAERAINKLNTAMRRDWSEFQAPPSDIVALQISLMQVANRILFMVQQ